MIELKTPLELIDDLVLLIENTRKRQRLQQKELAIKSAVPLPTYRDFIYKKKISLESLFKILIALRLFDNLKSLLKEKAYTSIEDIKKEKHLAKRINK